jgi:hypothetical protein
VGEVITKAEFARRGGVDSAAVSMWQSRGHLSPPAVLPDGRIDVDLAVVQLRERLDLNRQTVDLDRFLIDEEGGTSSSGNSSALVERLRLQRIEEQDIKLRRMRREELEHAGSLVKTEEAGKAFGRQLQELWADLDRWGADVLIPAVRRDVTAGGNGIEAWRHELRSFRQRQADIAERRASGLPELAEVAE